MKLIEKIKEFFGFEKKSECKCCVSDIENRFAEVSEEKNVIKPEVEKPKTKEADKPKTKEIESPKHKEGESKIMDKPKNKRKPNKKPLK